MYARLIAVSPPQQNVAVKTQVWSSMAVPLFLGSEAESRFLLHILYFEGISTHGHSRLICTPSPPVGAVLHGLWVDLRAAHVLDA